MATMKKGESSEKNTGKLGKIKISTTTKRTPSPPLKEGILVPARRLPKGRDATP